MKLKYWIIVLCTGLLIPAASIFLLSPDIEDIILCDDATESEPTSNTYTPEIKLLLSDGSVESIPLEEYVLRVVLKEMPADFEVEALKAQAVVARTYTLRRMEKESKHENATVCTNPSCCQGYCTEEDYKKSGGDTQLLNKVFDAVSETAGMVLTYQNELIEATYFSCSGGMTEDAVAVWGSFIPYLQATESPGEEYATHYTDTVKFKVSEFAELLDISTDAGDSLNIDNVIYTNGGGVSNICINGTDFTGTELRRLLGLKSTAFRMAVVGENVIITTKGFGHRVGMSQYGADAMAAAGSDYQQILAHYYRDTELVCIP